MQAVQTHDEIRDANTRYHDLAATYYDAKWGIDFGEVGRRQVLGKVRKLLAGELGPDLGGGFDRALEVGAGTGYFGLNLMGAGMIRELTATDISPGMLDTLAANARGAGLEHVHTVCADAEELPFAEQSFDLVLGHAVLHHLPDLELAFAEFRRVLRPGGRIVFAGEPSRTGDRLARGPKRAAVALGPPWRALVGARPADPCEADQRPEHHAREHHSEHLREHDHERADDHHHDHELERLVDIHAFVPDDLVRFARAAGFTGVQVRGEELLANWFGWFNRGLEASADPDSVPVWWRRYAFHGYLALQRLDAAALEPRLPPSVFYNLLLSAVRPAGSR